MGQLDNVLGDKAAIKAVMHELVGDPKQHGVQAGESYIYNVVGEYCIELHSRIDTL